MTAQFSDNVKYRGSTYAIAGKNGYGLFYPDEHGLKTHGGCTACYRGYVCTYAIHEGRLLLDSLFAFLSGDAPKLFGRSPMPQKERSLFDVIYDRLRHPVPYTGGLLLGDGFIEELYVHMGFHPAWKFREVHEVIFEDGVVVTETDRSEAMAGFREEISHRPLEPDLDTDREDISKWIAKCFSQEYRW